MKYKIIVGDYSGDGHGISDNFVVETNKTSSEINKAYEKCVKKTKCSLHDLGMKQNDYTHICCECDQYEIDRKTVDVLESAGVKVLDNCFTTVELNGKFWVEPEDIVRLYM